MFPVIIRQSSLGVSMCPMLAWEREGGGAGAPGWERPAAPSVRTLPGSGGSEWGLRRWDRDITPRESEAALRGPEEGRS